MDELVIAVAAVALIVTLTSIGTKVGIAPPLILIGVGIVVSLLPVVPEIDVAPEWILVGILPPLLYASAVSVPVIEFRRDLVAIGGLAVVLVVATAVAEGFILHAFLPAVPLSLCVALGAILSPTDAVATTIVKRLGVPSRIITMLDGESLLNDATALVLLRSAVAASAVGLSFVDVTLDFLRAAAIAAVIGALVGSIGCRLRSHIKSAAANTSVSFLIPFVAYIPAEELHASGLVAVVVAGLASNMLAPHRLSAQHRINESANWKTVEFLLEGAVFLLMGLQLSGLVAQVRTSHGSVGLAVGLGCLAIVIAVVVRTAFVSGLVVYLARRTKRKALRRDRLTEVGDALGLDMAEPASWSVDDFRALRLATQLSTAPVATGAERPGSGDLAVPLPESPGEANSGVAAPGVVPTQARQRHRQERRRQRATARLQRVAERRLGPPGRPAGPWSKAEATRRFENLRLGLSRYVADVDYLLRQNFRPPEGALLVWAGMRGVVTLAAAQTLPVGTPQRALLILIAFTVAAGSMLLQGGTLGWVARRLDLVGHDAAPEGEQTALDQTLGEAALKALAQPNLRRPNGEPYDPHVIALLKLRLMVTQLHDSTWGEAAEPGTDTSMADTTTTKVAANDPVPDAPADQADVAEPATSVPEASPAEAGVPTATVTAAPDSTPDPARTPFAAAAAAVWSQASEELIGGEADDESTLDTVEHKRQYSELRLVSLRAKREALLEARALGTYSYRTLSAAMAVLDADEISLELRTRTHE